MGQEALNLAAELCRHFEGLKLTAYRCPAGVLTIGFGSTEGVKEGMTITRAQAEALLLRDLTKAMAQALRFCPNIAGDPQKLAAIIDFCFNLGGGALAASTLRRKILAGEWDEAEEQFHRWVNAGGRKLKGLVLRRAAEAELFRGTAP